MTISLASMDCAANEKWRKENIWNFYFFLKWMQQLLQAAFVQLWHIGNQRIDVSSKWIRIAIVYMDFLSKKWHNGST